MITKINDLLIIQCDINMNPVYKPNDIHFALSQNCIISHHYQMAKPTAKKLTPIYLNVKCSTVQMSQFLTEWSVVLPNVLTYIFPVNKCSLALE